MKALTPTTAEAEANILPGQSHTSRARGQWCVALRNLKSGRGWAVLAGWRVDEAFDDDFGSQAGMAELAGVPHEVVDYAFGADFAAARDYFLDCKKRLMAGDIPARLNLPSVHDLPPVS